MTVVFPSEFIARIAYRKYMRVRARGQRLRAIFSKPRSDARGTETVDQLSAWRREDVAVQLIAMSSVRDVTVEGGSATWPARNVEGAER